MRKNRVFAPPLIWDLGILPFFVIIMASLSAPASFSIEDAPAAAAAAPGFQEVRDCVRGCGTRFRCQLARFAGSGAAQGEGETRSRATLVVFVHGCGCTASSWSPTMRCIAEQASSVASISRQGVAFAAFDMRGHGQTSRRRSKGEKAMKGEEEEDGAPDLSMPNLAADALGVTICLAEWFGSKMNTSSPVNVMLVGHSLGGAVVVRAAELFIVKDVSNPIMRLVGVTVVDIVEGTAIPSLKMLPALLKSRPSRFSSVEEAIEWTLSSGMCNNPASAAISVPAMLRRERTCQPRADIDEFDGDVATEQPVTEFFTWRTDIGRTAPFWEGWYKGLSAALLGLPSRVGKMLVLASTDRLDKPLTIGHMQGKFQFEVVQSAGHSVHEDQPADMANLLLRFLSRVVVGVRGLRLK